MPMLFLCACPGSPDIAPVDRDGDGFPRTVDCDDGEESTFPGANEFCDGRDNDCDGLVDEDALGMRTWRPDLDGDGYARSDGEPRLSCTQPTGHAVVGGDCDDADSGVHPGVLVDPCDDRDNDCDGAVDEDPDLIQYADLDQDGFGQTEISILACTADALWASVDGDCDDGDETVNPEAVERCNGRDDNCDGALDDADDPIDPSTWFPDLDGDGYGADFPWVGCDPGPGWVLEGGDCVDVDPAVNPVAVETCNNGQDDDCDQLVDGDDSCV